MLILGLNHSQTVELYHRVYIKNVWKYPPVVQRLFRADDYASIACAAVDHNESQYFPLGGGDPPPTGANASPTLIYIYNTLKAGLSQLQKLLFCLSLLW